MTGKKHSLQRKGFTHESAYNESKEWYTPPEIFNALGIKFDVDPASPGKKIVSWIPARKHLTVLDNGLTSKWDGRVWLNPPYGADTPKWLRRLVKHGNGIALVFSRTDTEWFHKYAARADAICFLRGRIRFVKATGQLGGSSGSGSILLAYGKECAQILSKRSLGWVVRKSAPNKHTSN